MIVNRFRTAASLQKAKTELTKMCESDSEFTLSHIHTKMCVDILGIIYNIKYYNIMSIFLSHTDM